MIRTTLALTLICGLALNASAIVEGGCVRPAPQPQQEQAEVLTHVDPARPRVEVAFVLDTTGSMGGLLEGAKTKIWAIANGIATGEDAPQLKMALVGYRDITDEYVTTTTELTDDLDAVFSDLMGFTASGGGDGPESVNEALRVAVNELEWSEDSDVLRIVYLVGDAPPHMDYEQDVLYPATCELAARKRIIINTIQCGGDGTTTPIWQEIARSSEGEFFQIDQSGGMMAIATPFDEELGQLSGELDGTLLGYGDEAEQDAFEAKRIRSDKLGEAAAPSAVADRAAYNAGEGGKANLGRDLVQDIADGNVDLESVKEEELPEEMQAMTSDERKAYVEAQMISRIEIKKQILELNQQRQEFLKDQALDQDDSFDQKVLESYRRQAVERGVIQEKPSKDKTEAEEKTEK